MLLTIAHLSDVHLAPLTGLGLRHANIKRALGLANWLYKRRHVHLRSVVDALIADLKQQPVEHIVVSGDLTNLGLPGEHAHALRWLQTVGPPEFVSVVPGNHDIYCPLWRDPGVERWRAYMSSDEAGRGYVDGAANGFPYVRFVGKLALVGVNSAVPTKPGEAIGEVGQMQLAALARTLDRLGGQGFRRLVVIHHPPLPGQADHRRGLRDADRLAELLRAHGADIVIHGHNHRDMHTVLATAPRVSVGVAQGKASAPSQAHVVGIASASIGKAYKHEPLGRYNLIRLDPARPGDPIEIVSRGLALPGGPVVEVARRML